ncbi:AraC-binding-like domain-containing protein [Geopseudomonas sagittaria]|uniref:AraC-binding-like domain-containing protein n=1 Tax=Geopseudomonas sagittaria TaxID=1135990 RepID=A0A1I5SS47_9GAMM|nr:transcriptional regulator FeaR [Pseudomonas sagittaria]SFP73559.1 AraC-binding-like domain-containing protein [Pseudomonas sagittaria]
MSSFHAISQNFHHWQQELQRVCGHFDAAPSEQDERFIGEIALQQRGALELAHIRTNAGRIARQVCSSDHGEDRHCFLIVNRSGHAEMRQDNLSIHLAPGDMALMDSTRACEILPADTIDHVSFHLDRAALCRHLAPRQRLFGKLELGSTSGRLLASLAGQIHADADDSCTQAEGSALQEALIALLLPTLRGGSIALADLAEGSHAALLRDQAQRLIGQLLQEPQLTPQYLAERLHISIRQLYRLFEDSGDSVCRYIQRLRLQRSAEDLGNPQLRHESITQIAFKWGFSDSAHFSRAFKKQLELSPKDYRLQRLSMH